MSQNTSLLKIAFSKIGAEEKYKLYPQWLKGIDNGFEVVDLGGIKSAEAVHLLENCSGLVLTGGPDIYPGLYQKEKELSRCEKVDRVRDSEEIMMIKKALEMKIPILAICRGAQLLNVYHGGSLFIDIPTDYGSVISHRMTTPEGATHPIIVEAKSFFSDLLQVSEGKVNSFHHQSIDKLAAAFIIQAKAPDGIIEAYSWKEPTGKSFLIAVQWHPERMTENNPFSRKLGEKFLEEAGKFIK